MSTSSHSTHSSSNVVGVHYRVGKKIGEGSFGIIYEGNILDIDLDSFVVSCEERDSEREFFLGVNMRVEETPIAPCLSLPHYPRCMVFLCLFILKKKKPLYHTSTTTGTNLLNNQQVAIKFEPRKSDAPQLRDEYRTYKILAGSSKFEQTSKKALPSHHGTWKKKRKRKRKDGNTTSYYLRNKRKKKDVHTWWRWMAKTMPGR